MFAIELDDARMGLVFAMWPYFMLAFSSDAFVQQAQNFRILIVGLAVLFVLTIAACLAPT